MLAVDAIDLLERAGYRQSPGAGLLLSGMAVRLEANWRRFLRDLVAPFAPDILLAPLFIAEPILARSGYLEHFPQNVVVAGSYTGAAPDLFITPAACLHVYPRLIGRDLSAAPSVEWIMARCARYEGGKWEFPFRSPEFHMAELVVVGREDTVVEFYERAQEALLTAFGRLGLSGGLQIATDAFFLGNDDGARIMQKLKELKKEFVVPTALGAVAVASLNRHEGYFARRFHLGADIASFCMAFGIERLVAAGLLLWGADARGWPEELR